MTTSGWVTARTIALAVAWTILTSRPNKSAGSLSHAQRATLVSAFTGWNDAGDAASQAAQTMIEQWQATPVAEIDPELFTDFATVRPHVRLDELRNRHIVWPTVGVWTTSLPGSDVVIVLGPEPSLRWRLYTEQIVGIARRCSATSAVSLGVPARRRPSHPCDATDRNLQRHDPQRALPPPDVELRGADGHRRRAAGGAQRLRRTDGIAQGSGTELRQHHLRRRRRSRSSSGRVRSSAFHGRRLRSTARSPTTSRVSTSSSSRTNWRTTSAGWKS